ncbi:DUF4405 domain-containing protein [Robbsia sp. KACC 23696]|uniref:DUF4405 domain-containing protein n=1 Tax=Robbsia sp. KACC 23696 TaxID=3149231 RepID=UPI00325B6DE2
MSASTPARSGKRKKSLWWTALHSLGTPLTAGLFLVSTVSGVALFFRWGPGMFHSMHEWLSMVLLLPFVLHLCKNWRPVVAYAKRKTGFFLFILCVIAAIPFAIPKQGGGRNGNPAFRALAMMRQAPIADIAPIFKTSPEKLLAQLQGAGYQASDVNQSLDDIATASNAQANDVIAAAMRPPARRGAGAGDSDEKNQPTQGHRERQRAS